MPHSIFFKFLFCGRIIKIQNTLPVLCNLDTNQFSLTNVHPNLDSALPAFLSLPPVSSNCKAVRKKECVCLLQHKGWGGGETGYCCIQVLQCRTVLEPGQVMWNSDKSNLEHMEIQLALHICHGWVSHIRTHTRHRHWGSRSAELSDVSWRNPSYDTQMHAQMHTCMVHAYSMMVFHMRFCKSVHVMICKGLIIVRIEQCMLLCIIDSKSIHVKQKKMTFTPLQNSIQLVSLCSNGWSDWLKLA